MHLLHTETVKLHEFYGSKTPEYTILSHRWEGDEITFKDVKKLRNLDALGWAKVRKSCDIAKNRGKEWIWIDTCCIDKRNSAELSEAINSMFRWYREAQECYVYLSDVPSGCTRASHYEEQSRFRRSQWFTRGWTLQELIAPSSVIFLDQSWHKIGTRDSLEDLIFSITGIENLNEDHDSDTSPLYQCVAVKMSWASRRVTTRPEDVAYCLMGLFNVNMPPLYGEGTKAFMRLQLEIMKQYNDASIFAWTGRVSRNIRDTGLLAFSPAAFSDSQNIRFDADDTLRPSFSMTNEGLRLDCFRILDSDPSHLLNPSAGRPYLVPIGCRRNGDHDILAICLYQFGPDGTGSYRIFNWQLFSPPELMAETEIRLQGVIKSPIYVIQPEEANLT